MRAGKMDRRVTLQARTVTRNADGEDVATYADLATVWAEKFDLRGREYFAAQQSRAEVTTRWRIRYRDDLRSVDRLVHDGTAYDVAAPPAETGRQQGLELVTIAVMP